MSHNKTEIDIIETIAATWHGLETRVEEGELTLANCNLRKWDVAKRALFRQVNGEFSETETCELFCTDDNSIVVGQPVNCDSYGLITNTAWLDMIQEALLGIKGATLATAGSVEGRNKVFVSVKLKELEAFKAAGREFLPYLNFGNGFDKQSLMYACLSTFCTVCANTNKANLLIAKGDKTIPVNCVIRHTKNAPLKINNVPELVDGFLGAAAEFKAIMDTLADKPLKETNARSFFAGLLANGKKEEISTRRLNQVERLTELFVSGKGNNGDDRSDAYQAVTEYATHESSGGDNRMRQIVSSEFGSANVLKDRALNSLKVDADFNSLVTVGEFNLAN